MSFSELMLGETQLEERRRSSCSAFALWNHKGSTITFLDRQRR